MIKILKLLNKFLLTKICRTQLIFSNRWPSYAEFIVYAKNACLYRSRRSPTDANSYPILAECRTETMCKCCKSLIIYFERPRAEKGHYECMVSNEQLYASASLKAQNDREKETIVSQRLTLV